MVEKKGKKILDNGEEEREKILGREKVLDYGGEEREKNIG